MMDFIVETSVQCTLPHIVATRRLRQARSRASAIRESERIVESVERQRIITLETGETRV